MAALDDSIEDNKWKIIRKNIDFSVLVKNAKSVAGFSPARQQKISIHILSRELEGLLF